MPLCAFGLIFVEFRLFCHSLTHSVILARLRKDGQHEGCVITTDSVSSSAIHHHTKCSSILQEHHTYSFAHSDTRLYTQKLCQSNCFIQQSHEQSKQIAVCSVCSAVDLRTQVELTRLIEHVKDDAVSKSHTLLHLHIDYAFNMSLTGITLPVNLHTHTNIWLLLHHVTLWCHTSCKFAHSQIRRLMADFLTIYTHSFSAISIPNFDWYHVSRCHLT